MDVVLVVGWIAAAVGTVLGVPQAYRLVRTRNVQGVALTTWQVMLAVNLSWLAHGFRIAQANMIVVNLLGLLSTLTILTVLSREKRLSFVKVFGPGLLLAIAMMAFDQWLGSAAFGLFAAIPAVAGQLTQSVELMRSERVEGVSTLFLVLNATNFTLWAVWGYLAGDLAVVIASVATGAAAVFNLVWLGLRKAGLGPVTLPSLPVRSVRAVMVEEADTPPGRTTWAS